MHRILTTLATAGAICAAAAPALAAGTTVKVNDNKFQAKAVHVAKGATVTWKWVGADAHNVTFKSFHSKIQNKGTFKHTFKKAGTFRYQCTLHTGMTGKVVVG